MVLSQYTNLYDILIPKENFLRKLNELVDFSFIHDELLKNYSLDMGAEAKEPIMLFKYLLLKVIFVLSDRDVVDRSLYDLSFKYFLDLAPEEIDIIDPSTLTKFRKLRIKNTDILNQLIRKTVEIALENDLIKSKTLIMDATHTTSIFNKTTPGRLLLDHAKNLRKQIYRVNEEYKSLMPAKPVGDDINEAINYCKKLSEVVKSQPELLVFEQVSQKLNYLDEFVQDNVEAINLSRDPDAMVGYKSQDNSFFGYKSHLSVVPERIITGYKVTSGKAADGNYLIDLVEISKEAGIEVEEVIGDMAYSGKANLEYTKERGIKLISKLNPIISNGKRTDDKGFYYNKDADTFVCPNGHLATKKAKVYNTRRKADNPSIKYFFNVNKCKTCPVEGCYKEGAKSKSYSVIIKSDIHKDQQDFEQTEYFKDCARTRYIIEAKNAELKSRHGLGQATMRGLFGMEIQAATTIFVVNMKRIMKLIDMKE